MTRALLIFVTFGCLHAASVLLLPTSHPPEPDGIRNWGFHFLAYTPAWGIPVAYGMFCLSLIPTFQTRIARTLRKVVSNAEQFGFRRSTSLVALAAVALLWVLRQKYPMLGDGYVRISELDQSIIHASGAPYIRLLSLCSKYLGWTSREAYQIASTALGVPFVVLALLASWEIGKDDLSRLVSAGLIIFSGTLQFYAGYMEIYAPLPVLVLLFAYLALKHEKGPAYRFGALATAAIGVWVHPLCAYIIPAALLVIWQVFDDN